MYLQENLIIFKYQFKIIVLITKHFFLNYSYENIKQIVNRTKITNNKKELDLYNILRLKLDIS